MKRKSLAVFLTCLTLTSGGCTSKDEVLPYAWNSSNLSRHLYTDSPWGAVQGGISARLMRTEQGIVVVVRNDASTPFEIYPEFENHLSFEIEAYDEDMNPLSPVEAPIFYTPGPAEMILIPPASEYVSRPVRNDGKPYVPPTGATQLIAVWDHNPLGTNLRGPVVTGPLDLAMPSLATRPARD